MEKSGAMAAAGAVHPPILVFREMHGHLRTIIMAVDLACLQLAVFDIISSA